MKLFKVIGLKLVILSLCFVSINVQAAPATAGQQLLGILAHIHSMTASFTQQAVGGRSAMRQNTQGRMALLRPGRFRWDINRPSKQSIIADGKNLWIYDIDLQQVTMQNLKRSIGNSPALILSGHTANLLNSYRVTRIPHRGRGLWFALRAKTKQAVYSAIDLHFAGDQIRQMRITDNLGQQSVVTFSHIRLNTRINQAIFKFHPPKGVDVIKRL